MKRVFTEEQKARRRETQRAWKERNAERIKAYDLAYRPRKLKLMRKKRNADRAAHRAKQREHYRKNRARYLERKRQAVARKLAVNPNWKREQNAKYRADNPGYFAMSCKRWRLNQAWRKFTATCAASRSRIQLLTNPSKEPT